MKTDAQMKAAACYKRQLARVRAAMADPMSSVHGTLVAYNAGCRCEVCRKHQSEYRRRRGWR